MLLLEDPGGQGVGGVVVEHRYRTLQTIGPVSHPASTRCTVHPETLTPYAHAWCCASRPGKDGSSAGWMFRMRCGKRAMNASESRRM